MNAYDALDGILSASAAAAVPLIQQNAALAWTIENSLIASATSQVTVTTGLGLPEGMYAMPEGADVANFARKMRLARQTPVTHWRGLDARHLNAQAGSEFVPLDVFAALEVAARYLHQDLFDFLTCRDRDNAHLDVLLGAEGGIEHMNDYTREEVELIYAFRKQMVDEAAPVRRNISAGVYVMDAPDLPRVQHQVHFEQLHLVLHPQGIFASIIRENWYIPFWWTPEGLNTASVWVHPRGLFALDVMLACIWRDACVVRERWSDLQRGRKGYAGGSGKPKHDNPVVLPRMVYRSAWGTSEERDYIQRQTARAHAVRGCYVQLAEGHQSHEADERAAEYGYPPPPEGHTFRRPHVRGEGESMPRVRRVVCKGLQVAKILLG